MKTEFWLLFGFGLCFLITRLVLAVRFPRPTRDQQAVFRTILALSAAGIAVVIPGFLDLKSEFEATTISATGALAVFVFVYLFNPGVVRRGNASESDGEAIEQYIASLTRSMTELSDAVKAITVRLSTLEERILDPQEPKPDVVADDVELRKLQLETDKLRAEIHQLQPSATNHTRIAILVIGVLLAIFIGAYAVFTPQVTLYQAVMLRLVFALTGAVLGGLIPGMLSVESNATRLGLRAASAFALFILIYFFTKAFPFFP